MVAGPPNPPFPIHPLLPQARSCELLLSRTSPLPIDTGRSRRRLARINLSKFAGPRVTGKAGWELYWKSVWQPEALCRQIFRGEKSWPLCGRDK